MTGKALAWVLLATLTLTPAASHAEVFDFDAAVALQGIKLAGDGIGDVYSIGIGAGAELDITVSNLYRLAFTVNPTYGFGTPDTGPLAAEPGGSLWSVPVLATVQVPFLKRQPFHPYVGLGAGLHYVRESIQFESGLGSRSQTESASAFGWHVMAGVEQNRPARLFAELWFQKSTHGSIEDVIDGRNLGGIQLRAGYRRAL